ncbi:MAG: protein kinase [Acidimicrobiia bacterium]|nr:protein kinase [Acidimicrobiia bacterium]
MLRRRGVPEQVCVKATLDQTSWHREAYFGELLRDQKRVIRIYDSFPVQRSSGRAKQPLYILVSELAEHGTVADYLEERGRGLTPAQAKREIIALLKVLVLLHGGSATHRDLTPSNVLVCAKGVLKLADFGIARHALLNKKAAVTAANWWFVPTGFEGEPTDDVYMMGQLLAMLLDGEADARYYERAADRITDDPILNDVIHRAIGPQKNRFADAWEMLQALEGVADPPSPLRSLRNKRVVFTGPLSIRRADAETLVLQAGGKVVDKVSKSLDVIVVGGRSPLYRKGHKGTKLHEVDKLNKAGARIRKIGEADFRRLTRDL